MPAQSFDARRRDPPNVLKIRTDSVASLAVAETTPRKRTPTTTALLPGVFEVVELPLMLGGSPVPIFVLVDGASAEVGVVSGCDEDNNAASNAAVQCVVPQ